jgi:putative oxidoreductase
MKRLPFKSTDLGLLALRIASGGFMLYGHGWDKFMNFSTKAPDFPSVMGLGGKFSLALATGAEFFAAALVLLGICTRWATLPLIATMGVAGFIIHGSDPWQKKELALIYLVMFIALFFTGGGKYSLDRLWCKK